MHSLTRIAGSVGSMTGNHDISNAAYRANDAAYGVRGGVTEGGISPRGVPATRHRQSSRGCVRSVHVERLTKDGRYDVDRVKARKEQAGVGCV